MARPTKRSSEREQAIFNALRVGNTRTASADAAEIHYDTFATWMKDPEFSAQVTKAEADAELRFVGQVAKHAAKSPQAAQWWLEHRRRVEWGQKTAIELSGPDGGPIESVDVSTIFNDHERDALAKLLREAAELEEANAGD